MAVRFLDPSYAFAMGWIYVFQWAVTLPLEITVAGTTVQYWGTDILPLAAWITIFWVVISKFGLWKLQCELKCRSIDHHLRHRVARFTSAGV